MARSSLVLPAPAAHEDSTGVASRAASFLSDDAVRNHRTCRMNVRVDHRTRHASLLNACTVTAVRHPPRGVVLCDGQEINRSWSPNELTRLSRIALPFAALPNDGRPITPVSV